MNKRKRTEIVNDICNLVKESGYIYSLCMILIEDHHIITEELNSVNFRERLNKNEISLLIGFLIKDKIDFTPPEEHRTLLRLKAKTYKLFYELHWALSEPFTQKMKSTIDADFSQIQVPSLREMYSGDDAFTEPIFYANDGAYDFQFLDFLKTKYKYDEEWLLNHRNFDFDKTILLVKKIRNIAQKRTEYITFLSLKEKEPEIKAAAKKAFKGTAAKFEEEYIEFKGAMEFAQYASLFTKSQKEGVEFSLTEIYNQGWDSFYKSIIELFIVRRSDFDDCMDFESFSRNFSVRPGKESNTRFNNVGDFNEFAACPLIRIDGERFFFPITYSVYEAVYECPYYWMTLDENYSDSLASHRGQTGEEITYGILSKVFGVSRTFRSIKIESRKGFDDTDIDILCILGSKALCVQVKSKKLTQPTKQGSYENLIKDFKGAVQDAYNQNLICRTKILESNARFYDSEGNDFQLPYGIDEVYIMGVTSENFPALTHQAQIFLEKEDAAPNALFMSIFDLEVVSHYLNNPYDFLYYLRQRIRFSEMTNAENELVYLSYHLQNKLDIEDGVGGLQIDASLGLDIDRDYYPLKMGLEVSNENNRIHKRWKSSRFEQLCMCIAQNHFPKSTDIIFCLFDWDGETRNQIVDLIEDCKQETQIDGKQHDRTILSNIYHGHRTGLTYHSFGLEEITFQKERWIYHCRARKYHSKADSWIGLASILGSTLMVDMVVFNDQQWQYDKKEDQLTKELLSNIPETILRNDGEKPRRNDQCPCGSDKKYKNCCGKP